MSLLGRHLDLGFDAWVVTGGGGVAGDEQHDRALQPQCPQQTGVGRGWGTLQEAHAVPQER